MSPWTCALLIVVAGAVGGVLNALLTENRFILPRKESGVLCPGFLSNVLIGSLAAFSSWASYGSGAGVELAKGASEGSPRAEISLTFSALAGAFFVGVAGARWITNEADKQLLKESVNVVARNHVPPRQCAEAMKESPRKALLALESAGPERVAQQ
jgi:hypothetical protein